LRLTTPDRRKHFRDELDCARARANASVAGFLYANAQAGNSVAQIFWLKTQAGWKEPAVQIEKSDNGPFKHEGTIRIEFVGPAAKLFKSV
jgi:hypothetical protein